MTPSSPSSDPTGPGPVTFYLVDDHAVFRSGVRAELADEPGLRVVGEAGTVPEAIDGIVAAAPDVVLLDVHMPAGGGVAVLRQARSLVWKVCRRTWACQSARDSLYRSRALSRRMKWQR